MHYASNVCFLPYFGSMKRLLCSLLVAFTLTFINAQPITFWEKSYGGSDVDAGQGIVALPDGGFIVNGFSYSIDGEVDNNYGIVDYWVLRLDADGEIVWDKNFGGSSYDWGHDIFALNDGNFILGGRSRSDDNDATNSFGVGDLWLIKMDIDGNILWEHSYGGSADDFYVDMHELSNGDLVVLGLVDSDNGDVSNNNGDLDFWLLKLDANGNILWEKNYGGSDDESVQDLVPTNDGGFLLVGSSESNDFDVETNNGNYDVCVFKVNADGDLEWHKGLGGSQQEYGYAGAQTTDDGFLVVSSSWSSDGDVTNNLGSRDIWATKLSASGELEWEANYGGSSDDAIRAMVQTSQNTIVIAGFSESDDVDVTENLGESDGFIIEIDEQGNLLWTKNFGGEFDDTFLDIIETAPNSYAVIGVTKHEQFGPDDYYVVKLGEEIEGCTNPESCNYNPLATTDDGTCNPSDCLGECNGEQTGLAIAGTPCDDGNPNTINDIFQEDCTCLGETTVSVSSLQNDKINVYPNPFNNWLSIDLLANSNKVEIAIYNASGKLMAQQSITKPSQINTQAWLSGIYFVVFQNQDLSTSIQKIVKP